jgi:HK97 family phage portal protein
MKAKDKKSFGKRIKDAFNALNGLAPSYASKNPIYDDSWWWANMYGVPPEAESQDNVKSYYKHLWIYIGGSQISRTISALPLKFYRRNRADGSRTEITNHRFIDLIKRPNEFMTYRYVVEYITMHLLATGQAYIMGDNGANQLTKAGPTRLFPMPSHEMWPIPDPERFVSGFKYRAQSGVEIIYPPEQITWFKFTDPYDYYRGLSPLKPASQLLAMNYAAQRWQTKYFESGADPGAVFSTDAILSPDEVKAIKENWARIHQGVEKSHEVAILTGGLKREGTAANPKDMDFANLWKLSREELLSLNHLPPAYAGIFEYANYANSTVQQELFWRGAVLPLLGVLESEWNDHFFPLWGEPDMILEHDISDVPALKPDELRKAQIARIFAGSGVLTVNEIRQEVLDMEPIDGGDELITPQSSGSNSATQGIPPESNPKSYPWIYKKMDRNETTNRIRKHIDSLIGPVENKMHKFFIQQKSRVLDNIDRETHTIGFTASSIPHDAHSIFDVEGEIKKLAEEMKPIVRGIVVHAGKLAVAQAFAHKKPHHVHKGGPVDNFDIYDPEVVNWIEANAYKTSRYATETTMKEVRAVLKEAVEEGWTVEQIKKEVGASFQSMADWRARAIAQTETNTAYNQGSLLGYSQAGVEYKTWSAVMDEKTRDDHANANDEYSANPIGIDDLFVVGSDQLQCPGDPNGSAEEVINCRCLMLPIFKEDLE